MIFIINQLILFKICFTRSDGIYISVTKQSLELNLHWIYIMSILHSCEFSEVYIPSIWKYSSLPISTHLYLCCTTCYHCVGGDRKGESWVEFRFHFFFFLPNNKFRNRLLHWNRFPVWFWRTSWLFIAPSTNINQATNWIWGRRLGFSNILWPSLDLNKLRSW